MLTETTGLVQMKQTLQRLKTPLQKGCGRGIVIPGGGVRYFTCAWVCIRMLRHLGCALPIELWHLGPAEMDEPMRKLIAPYGVQTIDAAEVRKQYPIRLLAGWELKPYAILHSQFQEVLLLDADNVPVADPTYLFDCGAYLKDGAVFWPDLGRLGPDRTIWKLTGVEYRSEPEFETGQVLVNKERCWRALALTMWMNEHSDFFYQHLHGDKDTFHLAWRKLGQSYAMPSVPVSTLRGTLCQHDLAGKRVFQHRGGDKWSLGNRNFLVRGFVHEQLCRDYLAELRQLWIDCPVRRFRPERADEACRNAARELCDQTWLYQRIGLDERPMRFSLDGFITEGAAGLEQIWNLTSHQGSLSFEIFGAEALTATLFPSEHGWFGRWRIFEKPTVVLKPLNRCKL